MCTFFHSEFECRRLRKYTGMGRTAPIMKKYSKAEYPIWLEKYRRGPIAPQISEVLKWVVEYGQLNPLEAVLVQTPGMWFRAQFRTPREERVPMTMPTHCTKKSCRSGILIYG